MRLPRPQFSLRTLVLTLLLGTAAYTLYHHFEPWRIQRTFHFKDHHPNHFTQSPDGQWILANYRPHDADNDVDSTAWNWTLWNTTTGERTDLLSHALSIQARRDPVAAAIFSNDSKWAVAGILSLRPGALKIWNLRTKTEWVPPLGVAEDPVYCELASNSRHLYIVNKKHLLSLIDLQTQTVLTQIPETYPFAFSQSGSHLAYLSKENSVHILDIATGKEFTARIMPPQTAASWTRAEISYLSSSWLIINVADDIDSEFLPIGHMLVFDLNSASEPRILPGAFRALSKDEKTIALQHTRDELQVLSFPDFSLRAKIQCHAAHDGFTFLGNGQFFIRDAGVFSASGSAQFNGYHNHSQLSPDHQRYLHTYMDGPSVSLSMRSISTDKDLQHFNEHIPYYFNENVFSADGRHFITYNPILHNIHLYTRHRPEPWYGLAWLPEFWLTLLLAPATFWSLWKDRRQA